MIPNDPEQSAVTPEPQPAPTSPLSPFWTYLDLLVFLLLCVPALFIAGLTAPIIGAAIPFGKPFQGLLAQLVWYALVFGALFVLLRARYGEPFWRSLGWRFPFHGVSASVFGGPVLAISLGYLGFVLRTPETQLPFQQMFNNRPTVILFAIFVILLGPLCEELAFRGFLMPLLMRSFGVAAGILATGLLFGLLHAPEYGWHWQHVLLIGTAGSVFGWVRVKTDSLAAAIFMHSTYNLTQFAAFLAQNRTV